MREEKQIWTFFESLQKGGKGARGVRITVSGSRLYGRKISTQADPRIMAVPESVWQDGSGNVTENARKRLGETNINVLMMMFLIRSIAQGKEKFGLPEKEKEIRTNFVR